MKKILYLFVSVLFLGCLDDQVIDQNTTALNPADCLDCENFPKGDGIFVEGYFNGHEVTVEQWGDEYILEGDIILTKEQFSTHPHGNNTFTSSKSMTNQDFNSAPICISPSSIRYWTNGIVPYKISPSFSMKNKKVIMDAIHEIESKTNISLVERTDQNEGYFPNYIYLEKTGGCSSRIGMVGGKQIIHLGSSCTAFTGIVMHEIMHAIGMGHEHCRHDRDEYIIVLWENFKHLNLGNFTKYNSNTEPIHELDFKSVMLYGSYQLTNEGPILTMTKIDGTTFGRNRSYLSEKDVMSINYLYDTPKEAIEETVPLYRYYRENTDDYAYTTAYSTLMKPGNGWIYDGIAAHVYAKDDGKKINDGWGREYGKIPLYQYYKESTDKYYYGLVAHDNAMEKRGWEFQGIMCYIQNGKSVNANPHDFDNEHSSKSSRSASLNSGFFNFPITPPIPLPPDFWDIPKPTSPIPGFWDFPLNPPTVIIKDPFSTFSEMHQYYRKSTDSFLYTIANNEPRPLTGDIKLQGVVGLVECDN